MQQLLWVYLTLLCGFTSLFVPLYPLLVTWGNRKKLVPSGLWLYMSPACWIAAIPLLFLIYCVCFDDRSLKKACWAVATTFAAFFLFIPFRLLLGERGFHELDSLSWGILVFLLTSLFATVAARRNEDLPSIEEVGQSFAALPSPALRVLLTTMALWSLALALCYPFVISVNVSEFFGNVETDFSPNYLSAWAPFATGLMVLSGFVLIGGLITNRQAAFRSAAFFGTLVTVSLLFLVRSDISEPHSTLGFPEPVHIRDYSIPGSGFYLLMFSGVSWASFLAYDVVSGLWCFQREVRSGSRSFDPVVFLLHFFYSLFIFIFCLSCFPLGIFLWRYFDEQDNRLAGAAFWGFVCGLILVLGRFLLVLVRAAST